MPLGILQVLLWGGILLGIPHLVLWGGILLGTCALAGGAELLGWPWSFVSWQLHPVPGLSTVLCLGTAAPAPPHPRCAAGTGMLGKAPKVGVPLLVGCSVPCCARAVPGAAVPQGTGMGRRWALCLQCWCGRARADRDGSGSVGWRWEPAPALTHRQAGGGQARPCSR